MEDGTSRSLGNRCNTDQAIEVKKILALVGGKWSLLVIALLDRGPRRFTELRREIDGISQRMLTLTLRQLERDGLVKRTVYPVVPPRVDYELTELGGTLLESVESLVTWAVDHLPQVAAARAGYDARNGDGDVPTAGAAPRG